MQMEELIKKIRSSETLSKNELVYLLDFPPDTAETYRVMAEARRISKTLSDGKAEIHAQFAVNLAPCEGNCLFCSFARANGVFHHSSELTVEQVVCHALQFEKEGANAVYMMSTARFSFERYLEIAGEVRKRLKPETVLIANVGDQSEDEAIRLKDAGFTGVYHALRLREGKDTCLSPEKRKKSIRNFKEAGLAVGTCVEPVGPEHTNEELAEMIEFTASIQPAFSGAARRIPIPGTVMAQRGAISEMRMAQIVAVTRLGIPQTVIGNCTHEPCTLGAAAGANLFWAEAGANPRDITEKTEKGRGETVARCKSIFRESEWDTRNDPSIFFKPPWL